MIEPKGDIQRGAQRKLEGGLIFFASAENAWTRSTGVVRVDTYLEKRQGGARMSLANGSQKRMHGVPFFHWPLTLPVPFSFSDHASPFPCFAPPPPLLGDCSRGCRRGSPTSFSSFTASSPRSYFLVFCAGLCKALSPPNPLLPWSIPRGPSAGFGSFPSRGPSPRWPGFLRNLFDSLTRASYQSSKKTS